jgi:uncharacterized protein YbcI
LIRSARQELRAISHLEIEEIIASIVGARILRSYFDIHVDEAEQIEVYVLEADIERRLLRQDTERLGAIPPKEPMR